MIAKILFDDLTLRFLLFVVVFAFVAVSV